MGVDAPEKAVALPDTALSLVEPVGAPVWPTLMPKHKLHSPVT